MNLTVPSMAPFSRRSKTPLLLLLLLVARARAGEYKPLANAEAVCERVPPSTGAVLPLHRRHGPCSSAARTKEPSIQDLLRRDRIRAEFVQRKFSAIDELTQSDLTVPTTLGSTLGTLEYVVTVGIGSPAVTKNLLIDTGSDLSWVRRCHDSSSAGSYTPFPCAAATCAQLADQGNGCFNADCQYAVHYGDGSSTTGTYGFDALALTASETVADFEFGCSRDENGFVDDTDGLLGLGGGAQSLVSQTAAIYGNAFSYCLPPTPFTSGFLTLGAPSSTSDFATTAMIRTEKEPTFYFVLLQDISVAGNRLGVPPSVFSAGSLMDSGTIITRLPPTAYSALSSAFRAKMTQYPLVESKSLMDTCFNFSGLDRVMIPLVALFFDGGAVVYLDANGIMLENCLAFAASDEDGGTGIIGNVQQRSLEVVYDIGNSLLSFRQNAC